MNSRFIRCLTAVLAVTAAPLIEAQTFDASAGNFNWIYAPYTAPLSPGSAGSAATPYGPPTTQGTSGNQISNQATLPQTANSNFQGVGQVAGSSSAKSVASVATPYTYAATYPATATGSIVLENSFFGGAFASGVPRYSMGDVITPPLVQVDGVTPAPAGYWRIKPVEPGELINGATPIETYSVNVTACGTSSKQVTVTSITQGVVVGATLLGQPITAISGTNITLAGYANRTISGLTGVTIKPALSYYYSPHAEKVYASQPGRVQITWVTLAATSGTSYGMITETFSVSSNSVAKVRTIYWTEGSFDGPKVPVTDGRITTINPIFNSSVPKAVAQEVAIPGYVPDAENLTTLSFNKYSGNGMIHAYNVEGRILIEYLGNVRLGNNVYVSLGIDVVDMVRAPDIHYANVNLGKTLAPHDGDASLTASPLLSTQLNGASYYGTTAKADGTAEYTAERESGGANTPDNGSPASPDAYNKVVFYWLEEGEFGMKWPKYQDRYWLRWSPNLADYAHYTVDKTGSTATNGLQFTDGLLPQIVYQDDDKQVEAKIDNTSQRLYVSFEPSSDLRNRSLLKFTNTGATWYVNLYTQAETRRLELESASVTSNGITTVTVASTIGLEVGMVVTSSSSTGIIASILDNTHYTLRDYVTTAASPVISNPSFEQNEVGGGVGYLSGISAITGWTFQGTSFYGLNNSSGPFADNGTIPNGTNVAFIQNQTDKGGLSTTITGLVAGDTYTVSMSVNSRAGYGRPQLKMTAGSASTVPETINSGSYQTKTLAFTASATTATLFIENTRTNSDSTLLIDNLSIATVSRGTYLATYTVESDLAARIDETTTATVGTRLEPPAGHEIAGYISAGTGYYPAGYLNPSVVGVAAANAGAIIPVNALPEDKMLTVRWYKKIAAPSANFKDLYVPGKIGRYTVSYPEAPSQIVIAQGVGTGDLSGEEGAGTVYVQNNHTQPGYNPNEEHAFMMSGTPSRAYALRDDLNIYSNGSSTQPASGYSSASYTSEPYVLVAYTSATDKRPAMHAYQVVRSNADFNFDYTATAGTLLVKPYPLPLLPLAMVGTGDAATAKDLEIVGPDAPVNTAVQSAAAYQGFTFKDRKGFTWIHRGPHATGTPTLTMKLYYKSQNGFFIPGATRATAQPSVGTILPFLRHSERTGQLLSISSIDADPKGAAGQIDQPLTITYRPEWPTDAPELRVGETLALPKFGLPQIRGQKSAQIFYQQSVAKDTTNTLTKNSVTLHDPTREKTVAFGVGAITLAKVPDAIKVSSYQGKIYFQSLPPHLQQRVFFDPLRGTKGTLVLNGVFHDEIVGEDYLDLNVLTAAELAKLKALVPLGRIDKSPWDSAVDGLGVTVETFIEERSKLGAYKVFSTARVGGTALVEINNPDTAVDSYALTATGQGIGYVTMVFGNGKAFTPTGDPVQVKVFKVSNQLYTGDLKVISSSNPLDEQVTLRHSADFAGKPEDYEFDWRWATGAASSPAIYSTVMTTRIGDPAAGPQNWTIVSDPGALTASDAQYSAAGAALPLPRSVNVHPVKYVMDDQNQATTVIDEATSYTATEKAAGNPPLMLKYPAGVTLSSPIPAKIVFSATLGEFDGFVLYINRKAALAFNAPSNRFTSVGASTGLTTNGLSKQFSIDPSYFSVGANTIEVAVYSDADANSSSYLDFKLEAAQESDLVMSSIVWQSPSDPKGELRNTAIIGGSPNNPFGGSTFVLNDRWFTMRYRPKIGVGNVLATGSDQNAVPWSRWMPPQFTEGWVKRVLAAINPFEQRVKDLYNNAVNTDVSVITQAGTRWEGDLALNMDNINDAGLIAIYETVLNRAKSMSIDANTNDPDTNNALILAAGYLNDLYTILGNEAYADAANSTISLDAGAANSSRFSFEGQVTSSLDEELALLRGRDDSVSPGVSTAPFYNRLVWNYTHGINSGEAIYAANYNIKEKVGSSTANGVVDESDAQRMFPQGHGDAYGHYLTALTGYYRLLWNQNFTWTPRAEAVTVLGVPVTVDFQDERKFAAAASNLANTAQQVVALTYRRDYKDDPASGWKHFRDHTSANTQSGVTRKWGLKEEVSRSTQGALVNWAMANAMLPEVDNYHTGIQKVDRTTVPELALLPAAADSLQTTHDNANAHLNPLGLSPGSIAFDIDPYFATSLGQELSRYQGMSHFAQIYDRALRSLNNAAGAFNQAALMSASLRDQTNSVDDYTTDIAMQETAYVNQLIDIYGRPYSGDIGAGKLYAQGYAGPDLNHWFIVDRPNDLVDTSKSFSVIIKEAREIKEFTGNSIADVVNGYTAGTAVNSHTVTVNPSQLVQYNNVWDSTLGSRAETGELQSALQNAQQSWLAISEANVGFKKNLAEMKHKAEVFDSLVQMHTTSLSILGTNQSEIISLNRSINNMETAADVYDKAGDLAESTGTIIAEYFPKVVGVAATDVTSSARGGAAAIGLLIKAAFNIGEINFNSTARNLELQASQTEQSLERQTQKLGFSQEEVQMAYEFDAAYREVTTQANTLMQLTISHQSALQNVNNVIARGNRILREREVFRQRAAAVIQGYRTKDLTFRTFRNEALEQYRSLFDLASRYTYMAAKAYDYETGLLGSPQGQTVFSKIVAARSLGDLSDGVPKSTASTLGDAGLAGTMAQLNAEFSVAEGRLGINNPDYYGTVFSLRKELFRILEDPDIISDDDAWKQTLEQHTVSNVLNDSDVATQCRNIKKPDGSAVPGIVIPFSTTIESGKNFFGLELCGGDHVYSPSSYATVISNAGIVLPGYVGMDTSIGGPALDSTNAPYILSATPYVYLIPCGNDIMRAPPLGDTDTIRTWSVQDQALPLPFNLGASDFNSNQYFSANGTLNEKPWIIRKHQAFRAVADKELFNAAPPLEYSSNRLIARSAWNTRWKIVIPAINLLTDEKAALDRFIKSVTDVQLYLRTYSHSGN